MGPIFNEKIDKKWNLWVREQYIRVLFMENWSNVAATVHVPYMNSNRKWRENAWKKKKKRKKKGKRSSWNAGNANPNTHYIIEYMIISHLNTYYFILTTITIINQCFNSFKCMIRRANLTSLYCWHFAGIPSAHWCYTARARNYTKISDFVSVSLNLHHWVHDYFTSK